MANLSELRQALQSHFLFADSSSGRFQYRTDTNDQCVHISGRVAGIQFRSISANGSPLFLNQIIAKEFHDRDARRYTLADSWTMDRLYSPILDFPSALDPCVKYIVVQYS
ncbi:hypothetical protein B0H17DRAFT_1139832 [Mycena rosella]|uniref:Uncharacterized protein n=1 Tax=Mycena rosella TaxID=1033263 RepID=A0AAD7GCM9_MYCRO|nr:hypothetical protein B0H17DRAFT_1139832 [Mycena rosella]